MLPLLKTIIGTELNKYFLPSIFIPFFLLLILTVGILADLYPALILSAYHQARIFRKPESFSSGKLFRQGLVVGQFAISVTLIICTFFMYRQLHYMQDKDLGFDKEQLINLRLGQLSEKAALFKHDLNGIAGVTATAPATISLVNVDNSSYLEWEGMKTDDKFLITQANVDPSFIPALGMRMISGDNFSSQKTNDTSTFIVNESAVKRMGYTTSNAIGRRVTFWGAKGTIIGVVKDFHFKPLSAGIEPFIFRYQPEDRYFNMFVRIVPGKSKKVIQQIEHVYKKYEAETPLEFNFVNEEINRLYSEEKRTAAIILIFSGLTIFVGCLGLFGLTVFSAGQRIKEIGIRKVLGAGLASIAGLLSKDFLKLVVIAIVIAIPTAGYITGRWLESYAYRINIEWWVFALVALGVIFIASFTISFQAIKAAAANPVQSLRTNN